MGEANARGTPEERREQSLERQLEEAEVVVFLKVQDGQLRMGMLARDDPPDHTSSAVVFAAFLSANFKELAGQAMALSASARNVVPGTETGIAAQAPDERPVFILDANGGVLKTDRAIELPSSAGQDLATPIASGQGGDFGGGGAEASWSGDDPGTRDAMDQSAGSGGYDSGSSGDSGTSDSSSSGGGD